MNTPTSPGILRRGISQSRDRLKDFILISEFSELVGPVAVVCISAMTWKPYIKISVQANHNKQTRYGFTKIPHIFPMEYKVILNACHYKDFSCNNHNVKLTIPHNDDNKFDKASFSVRVLSSDLQANRKFTIVHDSQILQSIPNEDYTHAYIHYMTLNDISARGYVRQFCMSYISRKERKLVENFLALKESFERVSTLLKCANLTLFFTDLIHRLKDLYHTADLIKEEGLPFDNIDDNPDFSASQLYAEYDFCKQDVPERDIKVVRQQIEEATEILNIVIDELNTPHNQRAIRHMDQGGSYTLEHFQQLISSIKQEDVSFLLKKIETRYEPRRTMAHTTYRFDRKLKSLQQLCGKSVYHNARQELDFIQKRFSRQFFVLNIEEEESKILKPLSSLLTIGRTPVVNVLENKKFNGSKVSSKPKPYKFSSLKHLQAPGADSSSFIHVDSDETDDYQFDAAFLQYPDYLEEYPVYMDPISFQDLHSTTQGQNVGLLLPEAQPADDHLTSGPASLAPSDQPEQFMTPQDSSPSLHSACNSSQPTTPTSNVGIEDVIGDITSTNISTGVTDDFIEASLNAGLPFGQQPTVSSVNTAVETFSGQSSNVIDDDVDTDFVYSKQHSTSTSSSATVKDLTSEPDADSTLRRDTITGLTDHIVESDFVLIDHPKDFDVEGTLRPTNLRMVAKSSSAIDGREYDQTNDALVPAHLRVVGIHGNGTSGFGIYGNNMGSSGGAQIEDQVVGIGTNFSVNSGPTTLSVRRKSGTLPDLKLATKMAHGASSPEYYTPTDRIPKDPLSPLPGAKSPLFEKPVVRVAGKIPLISYCDQCTRHTKLRPGRRILDFIKNYPNCQDFFYALLSGRPLVISGPSQMEQKIRSVVTTLWMFVPGYSSQYQVLPWHKEPIKLQDLQHFKLIGHCSDGHAHHMIPQHILPYISWWNYRDGKLLTPHYDGYLLNSISRRTDWKSEPMLMAHIHSVLLDIASKAFVYYHLYCVAKQQEEHAEPPLSPATPTRPKVHNVSSKTNVFPKLNIDKQCDKDIIQYFSEVIGHQQLAEWDEQASIRNTGIKLNYRKCIEQTCRAY